MSPHHSDQMSQRSQVSWVNLWMSKVKVPSVTEWVTEWQGHLLSSSGQLNTNFLNLITLLWSALLYELRLSEIWQLRKIKFMLFELFLIVSCGRYRRTWRRSWPCCASPVEPRPSSAPQPSPQSSPPTTLSTSGSFLGRFCVPLLDFWDCRLKFSHFQLFNVIFMLSLVKAPVVVLTFLKTRNIIEHHRTS